jgi:CRISPR type IV-associated protein Csf3
MQDFTFSPLKIRAYLQTPVISDKYLPLDSIIFNHFIRDIFGAKDITKPRQSIVAEYSGKNLPIQKRNMNEDEWYYACSFAVWSPDTTRDTIEYAKRFDTDFAVDYVDFGKKRAKVDTARGENKNYFIKEYTFNAPYVEWYCRGNKQQIETLLAFCTHIGKKSSQGFGAVLSWEVEETERDWYKNDNAGNLMRAVPSHKGTAVYGIRPSYWHPRHQTKVLLPS